jgi:hypothetical protein
MSKKSRDPRRIIQAAHFDGRIGPVTARELWSMQEDCWGILRDRPTDGHYGKPDGLVAKCMGCGSNYPFDKPALDVVGSLPA